MPELPEVETVRRGLEPVMTGQRFCTVRLNRPGLRFLFPERFAERLTGETVLALRRRAKFLVADLAGGAHLIMHLGMSGRFIIERETMVRPGTFVHETPRLPAHDHVVFDLTGPARIIYNDVRRFGFMVLAEAGALDQHPQMVGLGIEPLGNDFHADALDRLFSGKSTPLKAALLDQRLIAGLGNIYVSEALHRARLSPLAEARSICGPAAAAARDQLAGAIRDVLNEAVAAGGSTLRDYVQTDGALGYFQHRFRVYDRAGQPCPTPDCRGTVEKIVQAGRSTFYCAACQS